MSDHTESWTGNETSLLYTVQFINSMMLIWIGIPHTRSLPSLNIVQSSSFLLGIVLKK